MSKQIKSKQNISLIIGLSIPVVMVLFVGIAINGPRWFNNIEPPQYDFLYTIGQQNPYATYSVKDQHLALQESPVPDGTTALPNTINPLRLFVHDVSGNSSSEITVDAAMQLTLDGNLRSPDGFSVETGRRSGWFIFGSGGNYRNSYIVKESYSEKVNLETEYGRYGYYLNMRLLGWVTGNE